MDDPVHDGKEFSPSPGVDPGLLALRGERHILQAPDSSMLRLRYNSFYSHTAQQMLCFMHFGGASDSSCVLRTPVLEPQVSQQ